MSRNVQLKTLRLVAAMRELALLGCLQGEAARLLGTSSFNASRLAHKYNIRFRRGQRSSTAAKYRIIRDAYAANVPPKVLAAQIGMTVTSLKVTASKCGASRRRVDPGRHRRGYAIPDDQIEQYRQLRKLGLTFEECGYELGLIERPRAVA